MKNRLYRKLALSNIWRNRTLYIPYLLGCAVSVFCLYTFCMMAYNPGVLELSGGGNMAIILWLGIVIMCIFTFFFMRYANSFLFKRRLKELGLYSVLGLEKKHIARVLRYETVVSAAVSLVVGLTLGVSLGRLMFLLVQAMIQRPIPFRSGVSVPALLTCAVYFSAMFALLSLINHLRMRRLSPAALLMGAQQGEREPKSRWLLAVVGALLTGAGYYLALTVTNPVQALITFFSAVVLVILGTYALFSAGSIVILKAFKRIKRVYYKRSNFITLSGMLYRMKQHAVGLATICILSTMVIVTLGTTTALYFGQRDMLGYMFPYQLSMDISYESSDAFSTADQMMETAQAETGVSVTEKVDFEGYEQLTYVEGNRLSARDNIDSFEDSTWYSNRVLSVALIDAATYQGVTGESLSLLPDETVLFAQHDVFKDDTLWLGNESFRVARRLDEFARMTHADVVTLNQSVMVFADEESVRRALSALGAPTELGRNRILQWDIQGNKEQCLAYAQAMERQVMSNRVSYGYQSRFLMEEMMLGMGAGFLFLGLFIGLMFLMATTLIIYFKQISEGYSDHDRFLILQKVGMDKAQVKSAINRQVLSVFALPLLVAGLHTLGAMPMMRQLLAIFGLSNTGLINLCVLLMGLCFAAIYAFVYLMTIKAYYRIVRWD